MKKIKEMYDALSDEKKGIVMGLVISVVLYIAFNVAAYFL